MSNKFREVLQPASRTGPGGSMRPNVGRDGGSTSCASRQSHGPWAQIKNHPPSSILTLTIRG